MKDNFVLATGVILKPNSLKTNDELLQLLLKKSLLNLPYEQHVCVW